MSTSRKNETNQLPSIFFTGNQPRNPLPHAHSVSGNGQFFFFPTYGIQSLSTPTPHCVKSPAYCFIVGDDQPPNDEKSEKDGLLS